MWRSPLGPWLVGSWLGGTWTPSLRAPIYGLAGLLLGAVCIIPDHLCLRRQGDADIRRLNALEVMGYWRLLTCVLVANCLANLAIPDKAWDLHECYLFGLCLGTMIAWYPHVRVVWKRMWELYELEKTAEFAPIAAGKTPAPRVEG